jgi:hypothetical protein
VHVHRFVDLLRAGWCSGGTAVWPPHGAGVVPGRARWCRWCGGGAGWSWVVRGRTRWDVAVRRCPPVSTEVERRPRPGRALTVFRSCPGRAVVVLGCCSGLLSRRARVVVRPVPAGGRPRSGRASAALGRPASTARAPGVVSPDRDNVVHLLPQGILRP